MATGRVPTTANSPLTAKGDLFGYSTTQARVPVGNDGETLVADSSATTGLRWQGNFAAGKNKIINGDFQIWQRGTTATVTGGASATYLTDRFFCYLDGSGNGTQSQQTFSAGTAPVAGYEGQFFHRLAINTLGTTTVGQVGQRIENVRTFANQTITFSFWAKADSARTFSFFVTQYFGSGGSADVTTNGSSFNVTTSWQRFNGTVTIPSISGKTLGAGSFLSIFIQPGITSGFILDTWGWQLEAGNVATAFQTATGTLAGELAACQRYYVRFNATNSVNTIFAQGIADATTGVTYLMDVPVTMRIIPTAMDFSTLEILLPGVADYAFTALTLDSNSTPSKMVILATGATGLTQSRPYMLRANNSTSAYIGFTAEL